MELVNCEEKYWEFVRLLRTHKENINGFVIQNSITQYDQKKYLSSNKSFFKICIIDKTPVGYIGLIGPSRNEITLAVDPHYKQKGVGKFMIESLKKDHTSLWAKVKFDNLASNNLFSKLDFILKKEKQFNFYYYDKQPV